MCIIIYIIYTYSYIHFGSLEMWWRAWYHRNSGPQNWSVSPPKYRLVDVPYLIAPIWCELLQLFHALFEYFSESKGHDETWTALTSTLRISKIRESIHWFFDQWSDLQTNASVTRPCCSHPSFLLWHTPERMVILGAGRVISDNNQLTVFELNNAQARGYLDHTWCPKGANLCPKNYAKWPHTDG